MNIGKHSRLNLKKYMIAFKWHSNDLKFELQSEKQEKARNIDLINQQMDDLMNGDDTSAVSQNDHLEP